MAAYLTATAAQRRFRLLAMIVEIYLAAGSAQELVPQAKSQTAETLPIFWMARLPVSSLRIAVKKARRE